VVYERWSDDGQTALDLAAKCLAAVGTSLNSELEKICFLLPRIMTTTLIKTTDSGGGGDKNDAI
jgi:hypothetical protein